MTVDILDRLDSADRISGDSEAAETEHLDLILDASAEIRNLRRKNAFLQNQLDAPAKKERTEAPDRWDV
jgi:hypothetical protein